MFLYVRHSKSPGCPSVPVSTTHLSPMMSMHASTATFDMWSEPSPIALY